MPHNDVRYHWEVRDDLGRRYATSAYTVVAKGCEAQFPLRLHPPVNPLARELRSRRSAPHLAGVGPRAAPLAERDWESGQPDWQEES